MRRTPGAFCLAVVDALEQNCSLEPACLLPFVTAILESHSACSSANDRVKHVQVPFMLCATTSTSIFLILPLIQTTINAISTCETRNGSEFPSHYSLAACAFLADTIFGDSSPDGRVRRQAIAMFNRNASLLDCSVYLAHAMASVALNPTGCETGATAQNVFVALMTHAAGIAAPSLKLRLGAFVTNASYAPCLNALTMHVLASQPPPFFCDYLYALCQLGHAVPPAFQPKIEPTLQHAITIARSDAVIRQAALCYVRLLGTDHCSAVVTDTLAAALCSPERTAVAIALAALDVNDPCISNIRSDDGSINPTFLFDVVAYTNYLPSFFHSLQSAALRSLSLQIIDRRAHPSLAPFVLKCLFALPHFLLKGFVFKTWLQLLRKMQCSATLLATSGGSSSAIQVAFGHDGGSSSIIHFTHRTGVAAIFLPLKWQDESARTRHVFELASSYSDVSDDGLFLLQQVVSHLVACSSDPLLFPTFASVVTNICILNHAAIEEVIEVVKGCPSLWLHVLHRLKQLQTQDGACHPAGRRLANVLLSCIAAKETASIKRGHFSTEICSLFVSWSEMLGSYDLIISLWLESATAECFMCSCDRSVLGKTFFSFFSCASHPDSLRTMTKKLKLVAANASESTSSACFASCCSESLLHVIAASAQDQSHCGRVSSIVDSALAFLDVLISNYPPFLENYSLAHNILEFILRGVQSPENSLGALAGQTLSSLFNSKVADTLMPRIERAISAGVSDLFHLFRQHEYTSAARIVSFGLVSTCPRVKSFTSIELLREVDRQSGGKVHIDFAQLSSSDTFSTIKLLLGSHSFISCGSLCTLRLTQQWDDATLAVALDCVSLTLTNSHQLLAQDRCDMSDSSGDDDQEQQFVGQCRVFEVRRRFRTIYEGMLVLCEILRRCPAECIQISPEWLEQMYVNIMGLCCNVDHVGATETAAVVLFQMFELRILHLQVTARMLLLRTLSRALIALRIEEPKLLQYLQPAGQGIPLQATNANTYCWRRSSHVCLPIVASLKALASSHDLHLPDGSHLFDAFVDAVIAHAKLDSASTAGVDCLNLLHYITNEHVMTSRVQARRGEILSVCFTALCSNSFNCQSAACLVISNLVTKVYGVLFARSREFEVRICSLTCCDWAVFTSLSPDSAPGALIALFSIFSMIRASDDELLSLEPVERSRHLVLACCRSPIAKLRFCASRALPRLVAPSATTALINELCLESEDTKRKQQWNHLHGLTLAIAALRGSLRAE